MVSYAGKLVLAPMVRAGEISTRLLALKYGADLVWSPEIVDKKLLQCHRKANEELKTIEFVMPTKQKDKPSIAVFCTKPESEGGRLIFQLGTAIPTLAVEAARVVIRDVDGIDVNAGCPKHFSIHSGMGAALLKTPETLCNILCALVNNIGKPNNKPISVKIRLLEDESSTLDLVRKLCKTGIANLTVHCRTTSMLNAEAPIYDYLLGIYNICKENNVSLIMNGGIKNREEFMNIRRRLHLPEDVGGMIAGAAEKNATVFSSNPMPWYKAVQEFLKISRSVNNHTGNVKYMLGRMVPGKSPFYQYFTRCKDMEDVEYIFKQMNENGECILDSTRHLKERWKQELIRISKYNNEQESKKREIESQGLQELKKAKKV